MPEHTPEAGPPDYSIVIPVYFNEENLEATMAGLEQAVLAAHQTLRGEVIFSELLGEPLSVEAGRFRAYAQAGVSRLSMGVQALNDRDLRRLGRIHSVAEARQAFDIARQFLPQVSFDLIYARQDQTLAAWRAELTQALSMAVDHLSLYQLTVESGTPFAARLAAGGLAGLPGEDLAVDMYAATQEICAARGLPGYEISNHARPGAECRHNLIYWRHGDYAGIGPGAHGRLTLGGIRQATEAWRNPDRWLRAVDEGGGARTVVPLQPKEQAAEYLLMGLRLREGIETRRFAALAGSPLDAECLAHLVEIGMITAENGRVRATEAGRPVLNAIIEALSPA